MNQHDLPDVEAGRLTPEPTPGFAEHLKTGAGAAPDTLPPEGAKPQAAVEETIWTGRTHWKHFARLLGLWVLVNLVVCGLVIWAAPRWEWLTLRRGMTIIAVVLLSTGLEFVGRRVLLRILDHRYRLTTQRLFIERGLLSQTIDQTELIRVDDVRIRKTLLGRILGVGSIAIVSTDATDREAVIEGIARPDEVAEAIRDRTQAVRRKSLFVENL